MEKQVPESVDEAIGEIVKMLNSYDDVMQKYETEDYFLSHTHHFVGQNIRNNWFLWWSNNHRSNSWPREKPKLVAAFNDLGIKHADDMSGIILTSAYRRFKKIPEDIPAQVQKYKAFWAKNGGKFNSHDDEDESE